MEIGKIDQEESFLKYFEMKTLNSKDGFLGIPKENFSTNKVLIIPFGLEQTVSYEGGTKFGPQKIIKASHQVELFDEELDIEPYKLFNIKTLKKFTIGKNYKSWSLKLEKIISDTINQKIFPITLGGEHSLTPSVIKSMLSKYKKITIIHIDAHTDLRNSYLNNKYSHACAMKRCSDFKNVEIISLGIRNISIGESLYLKKNKRKIKFFWAKDLKQWNYSFLSKIIKNRNVYITIDVDALDSSLMPATGTPEPGGLFWSDIIKILKTVCKKSNVIGADIVELSPRKGLHSCDFLVAKLIYKFLSLKFTKKLNR